MSNRTVIGGWFAINNGFEPGKQIEYKVESVQGNNNNVFQTFTLFKPWKGVDKFQNSPTYGQEKWFEGKSFSVDSHAQIIDRINHMMASGFTKQKGTYVFHPEVAAQPQPQPQQMQMAPQYPQQQYAQPAMPQQQPQYQQPMAPVNPHPQQPPQTGFEGYSDQQQPNGQPQGQYIPPGQVSLKDDDVPY